MRRIWTILTMRCAEADRLNAIGRDHCTRSEWLAMRIHQLLCRGCRAAAQQLRILRENLAELDQQTTDEPTLPPAARARLQARLDAARQDGSAD